MTTSLPRRATTERVRFPNSRDLQLAGLFERPEKAPRMCAVFSHCFTCTQDVPAIARVSRALAAQGIAVLRYDMTGLGGSEGSFEETNFSTAVDDLRSAVRYLEEHETSPKLLVGHSFGGAASLAAAESLPHVGAVATLAAPSDPGHVLEHFPKEVEIALEQGSTPIAIGGRSYTLTRQFIEDLRGRDFAAELAALTRPVLILHSPSDRTVAIRHAQRIYQAVRGMRSFVALPGADHVLSDRRHTDYAAGMIDAWVRAYE